MKNTNQTESSERSIIEKAVDNTVAYNERRRLLREYPIAHLSKQTLNAIEAREAMMKIADRLEAVIETNQLNHATAFGNLLFLIRGEATQVKIDANKLMDKAN